MCYTGAAVKYSELARLCLNRLVFFLSPCLVARTLDSCKVKIKWRGSEMGKQKGLLR